MLQSSQTQTGNLQIQVWERLQLAVGEAGKEGVYSCRVMDIEGDRLVISRPHFEYGHSLLADNRIISVRFTRADAAYSLSARICELEPKSSETMHLTELGKVKRLQRRRFVRLDMVINLKYVVLPRPLAREVDLNHLRYIESRSHNLSAGGILIAAAKSIKSGSLLLLNIEGSGLTSLPPMVCAICRQGRRLDKEKYVAGLEFILKCDLGLHLTKDELANLPERAKRFDSRLQNALVSELFTEQLTMRQKGIL